MGDRIHGGEYRLAWSDEFDGAPGTPPDRKTWRAETGGSGWGNQELQYYTDEPGNAALDGTGNLALVVRRVNPELACQQYGNCGHLRAAGQQGPGVVSVRAGTGAGEDPVCARRLARLVDAGPGYRPVRVARLR
jgi:hypothetical protein